MMIRSTSTTEGGKMQDLEQAFHESPGEWELAMEVAVQLREAGYSSAGVTGSHGIELSLDDARKLVNVRGDH
jgi:hypothetical protein